MNKKRIFCLLAGLLGLALMNWLWPGGLPALLDRFAWSPALKLMLPVLGFRLSMIVFLGFLAAFCFGGLFFFWKKFPEVKRFFSENPEAKAR